MRIPLGSGRFLLLEIRKPCRHNVVGICPRCDPQGSRTRLNKKLCLAIAWLDRLTKQDPSIANTPQVRRIASDALNSIADL